MTEFAIRTTDDLWRKAIAKGGARAGRLAACDLAEAVLGIYESAKLKGAALRYRAGPRDAITLVRAAFASPVLAQYEAAWRAVAASPKAQTNSTAIEAWMTWMRAHGAGQSAQGLRESAPLWPPAAYAAEAAAKCVYGWAADRERANDEALTAVQQAEAQAIKAVLRATDDGAAIASQARLDAIDTPFWRYGAAIWRAVARGRNPWPGGKMSRAGRRLALAVEALCGANEPPRREGAVNRC